jgi:hypothetical protein
MSRSYADILRLYRKTARMRPVSEKFLVAARVLQKHDQDLLLVNKKEQKNSIGRERRAGWRQDPTDSSFLRAASSLPLGSRK